MIEHRIDIFVCMVKHFWQQQCRRRRLRNDDANTYIKDVDEDNDATSTYCTITRLKRTWKNKGYV